MGKKRRTGNILRRMASLALALVLGFSGVSGHVTAYALSGDVKDGSTLIPKSTHIPGSADVAFDRELVYIAVTPVFEFSNGFGGNTNNNTTDTEDIIAKNAESPIPSTGTSPGGALKGGTYKTYYTRLKAATTAARPFRTT